MFTWRHFLWLAICIVLIVLATIYFTKEKGTLTQALNIACVICIFSEISKMISVIQLVPSTNDTMLMPYIPANHLPLHFCSIQILLIFFVRFTKNSELRENVLAFMYPTCIAGAILALLMPSIFTTSIPVEKAFRSLISYQFFIYHSMLIFLGIMIVKSNEIKWTKKHMYTTILMVLLLGFLSLYINSIFASPTYVDGVLVSVDFWTNFFFTYQNPLNIPITQIWQWYVYLLIIICLTILIIVAFYMPLLRKNASK